MDRLLNLQGNELAVIDKLANYHSLLSLIERAVTIDVEISRSQASHEPVFPDFLWLMLHGLFVPTFESPRLDSTQRISSTFKAVMSC